MGIMSQEARTPDTIVLIHGLWVTSRSWERWAQRYESRGFRVLTPSWPGMEADVEQLRADPAPIAGLTLERVVQHYDQIIRGMSRPPIVMGHSYGGTVTQILLDRGLGAAGVAIDSAPVRGVLRLPLTTLRATMPVLLNPGNRHRAIPLTPEQFHFSFANPMSREESDRAYRRYAVPAAGHVLFEGATANLNPRTANRVDYGRNERAPLLLIAGGADHLTPPAVTKANAALYQKSRAVTGYREFPGRGHFTIGQDGWEQVADHALEWVREAITAPSPAGVGR